MVVPVGPPAITLAAVRQLDLLTIIVGDTSKQIADISDVSDETEGFVDCTLMYSYIVTPFISLPVSVALTIVRNLHK